ncbi:MAG: helix-turn-helix domain-containing protein [Catonella sp.]
MRNDRLKEIRLSKNYTQKYIADAIQISVRSYQRYESGDRTPNSEVLMKISGILDVSMDYLSGKSDKK